MVGVGIQLRLKGDLDFTSHARPKGSVNVGSSQQANAHLSSQQRRQLQEGLEEKSECLFHFEVL